MLFFFFFFTKLDQMSRVGSRGRHPKCRSNKPILTAFNVTEILKLVYSAIYIYLFVLKLLRLRE